MRRVAVAIFKNVWPVIAQNRKRLGARLDTNQPALAAHFGSHSILHLLLPEAVPGRFLHHSTDSRFKTWLGVFFVFL
jgi:hypothetical protein